MANIIVLNTAADLTSRTLVSAENPYTITGLHTFSRNPSAPFAVTAASAVVANLDADKVDGIEGAAFALLAGANTWSGTNAGFVVPNATDIAWKDLGGTARTAVKGTSNNDLELRALAASKQIVVKDFTGTTTKFSIEADTGNTVTAGTFAATGSVTAGTNFTGPGTGLTSLPAAQITGTLPAISGVNLTNLNATNVASGTLDTARLPSNITVSATIQGATIVGTSGGQFGTIWNTGTSLDFGQATNAAAEVTFNFTGYSLGAQFRDLGIYDGKGVKIAMFTGQTTAKGLFFSNGYNVTVGKATYDGRGTTNPTNAINIYVGTPPVGVAGGNFATLYAKDAGAGNYRLYYLDSGGTERGPL